MKRNPSKIKLIMETNFNLGSAAVLFCLVLTASCDTQRLKELENENEALKTQLEQKDSVFNEYILVLNEIEDNLTVIKEKENIITLKPYEERFGNEDSIKTRIVKDIQTIGVLMNESKHKINLLQSSLNRSEVKVEQLNKLIGQLTKRVSEKDSTINKLNQQLTMMDVENTSLREMITSLEYATEMQAKDIEAQQKEIEKKTELLETGYYIINTSKYLTEKEVITKEGGVLGLGKVEQLQDDFDQSLFTKINIHIIKKKKEA